MMEKMETKRTLSPALTLIKSSFEIYFKKENLVFLLKFALVNILLGLLAALPFIVLGILGFGIGLLTFSQGVNAGTVLFSGLLILLGVILAIAIGLWLQVAQIKAVSQVAKGKAGSIEDVFRSSWGNTIWRLLGVDILSGLIIALGFVLFVIPGIIFLVWFSFAQFIVVTENVGIIESLRRSKKLVSGYFWGILGRFLVFILFFILIRIGVSIVVFVGPILLALFSPYFILLPYLLYEDVKRVKGSAPQAQ